MTEQEAIEMLEHSIVSYETQNRNNITCDLTQEVLDMAVEALEKQIPKKPDLEGDGYADGHLVYDTWICPNCGVKYEVDYEEYDYCPDCGQHIDWTQESEVETAPAIHGNIIYRNDIPHCSICEKVIDPNSCYCKWCGAKMEGGAE